jgi:hypothetical protein
VREYERGRNLLEGSNIGIHVEMRRYAKAQKRECIIKRDQAIINYLISYGAGYETEQRRTRKWNTRKSE